MFKGIQNIFSGITKKISTQTIIILIVFLVIIYALYNYSSMKGFSLDGMDTGLTSVKGTGSGVAPTAPAPSLAPVSNAAPAPSGYVQQPVANPSDLLPKDANSQWGDLNALAPSNIATPDLLQAGYHIGLDTIGQTLKNANYQLRSDPIIQKANVGPWMNSTIEPDYGRVPLEIGGGSR